LWTRFRWLELKRAMIEYLYLGRVAYDEGLRLQAELVELRLKERVENVLLLLEHPPVLTLGGTRTAPMCWPRTSCWSGAA